MRTISLVLIGLFIWIMSLSAGIHMVSKWVTLGLTIVNTFLLSQLLYKNGETNIPSSFVATTYWLVMSVTSSFHVAWQTQLVVFMFLVSGLIWSRIKYQDTPTEECFLISLICCFLAPALGLSLFGIISLWVCLLIKGYMTWRVWCASLIAIAQYAMIVSILHYMDWVQWLWWENIPQLNWQRWILFLGIFFGTLIVTLLPLRRPSVSSGMAYIVFVIFVLGCGVGSACFDIHII